MKLVSVFLTVMLVVGLVVWFAIYQVQGPGPEEGTTAIRFVEVEFPFVHASAMDMSLPFLALAAVDVDGDGIDEVFLGNGRGSSDGIFRFDGTSFDRDIDASEAVRKADSDATMGAASIDTNGDGLEELFVARESGVHYYLNMGDGGFSGRLLAFAMDENTVPLSIALGDINKDGMVDLYVSGYIKLSATDGETNFNDNYGGYSYLLLNNGDNTWTDISQSAGVFRQHNTFAAVFVELDNDGWVDLVVAQDTGVVETWRNRGDNTFERRENPTVNSYPMGIGAGDIDNDGLVDLYFSNVGRTLPRMLLKGNLADDDPFNMNYILLHNEGNLAFTDVATSRKAAEYGFGWGTTIADFNNDGRMDLYFAQNYARFPGVKLLELYPGRLLEQQADATFLSVEGAAGLTNQNFGITQIVSDFNGDAQLDMVVANLDGPARAFLHQGGGGQGFVVRLPSEPAWLNTRVHVTTSEGATVTRQLIAATGLCSDGGDAVHFGLGDAAGIEQVVVERPDGWSRTYTAVRHSEALRVVEENL